MRLPLDQEPAASQTIAGLIEHMGRLSAAMPAGDGVRAFNEMYLVTTQQVAAAIGGTRFADPVFMTRLDVVFANRFLRALELHSADPTRTPRCWRALIDARTRPGITQLQFAIAGMNAHINYDLPRALVMTTREFGGELDSARRSDYLAVNKVLAQTQPMVRQQLLTGPFAAIDHALGNEDDRVAMWGIEQGREFAWTTAQTLWAIHQTPIEQSFTHGLDRMVELASRLLLNPGP